MNSMEKKKRFCFNKDHDNFILTHFISLKNIGITKNNLFKQITRLCNQQSSKTDFFNGKHFHWKAISDRISNFIDPQINKDIKISKQMHYKIFVLRSEGKSNKQTIKELGLGNIPDKKLKNSFKMTKQRFARSIHKLYKVKYDQMNQQINKLYDSKNLNHFRAVLVLFSKGKLLKQYGNNQNLIKITKLLELADQYKDLGATFEKISKKGTDLQQKDRVQKRLCEIAKRLRNALKRICHFYTQIEKKGVKFSHETAKNQEQLSQEIILNDYKGQTILADRIQKLKDIKIQYQNEDILLDLDVIRTTQDVGYNYQFNRECKIQGTNSNVEVDFEQITTTRRFEHSFNQSLRQREDRFIQLHDQDKYSDCFFSDN